MKTILKARSAAAGLVVLAALLSTGSPAAGGDRLVEGDAVAVSDIADKKMQQTIAATFNRIEAFENITVEVLNGVVKLGGRAPSFATAEKAVELVSRFEGVLFVVDDVEILTKVDTRLAPAWRKVKEVFDQALEILPLVVVALLILAGTYFTGWLLTAWEWPYNKFSGKVLLQNLIRQLIRYAFAFAGLMIALEVLDLTSLIGAFLGAAGLFGLAIGFAFKDIVENYIAGFLLSIRSPFRYMDWIGVDRHEGSVVRVTPRELVLMTLEGNHVRIPNAQVFKSIIYNYTLNPLRRFAVQIGVGVEENLSRVQRIGCEVLASMKGVSDDPGPSMRVLEFGDSAMLVSFAGWVNQKEVDFLKVRSEAVRLLKEALDQENVDVPAPIRTVINVDAEAQRDQPPADDVKETDIKKDAGHADVERESYLNEQIEHDRQSSGEVDLLDRP